MIRINLLPHREQKKAAHRRRFQHILIGSVLAIAAILAGSYLVLNSWQTAQQERNQRLQQEIDHLNAQLKDIELLRQKRSTLLTRQALIEKLQTERGQAVHIFDELIRMVPEGVYLRTFSQNGQTISLGGSALSSARVSQLMHNLSESKVFADPVLVEVAATVDNNIHASRFSLNVSLRNDTPPAQGVKK
ncbi:PilN domain-containing protein [Vogesella sp. LIG4]|uniref:PilN domain-containing protein n=1 Tax=Vogesella sp. LIG4 TaxID=1192162 RepID=UPI000820051C|nr:PilN domain-containing protein [Vogesella sp. LIG4]SCK15202.1 type IV pilus assembly protein PilN [Vogesella sp. LIG4]